MALRKTFSGLKLRKDYKSLNINIEDIRVSHGPGRSNCDIIKWLDIIWENTSMNNPREFSHRYPRYFSVGELLDILPEVLAYISLHNKYRETNTNSSCEICPRFDFSGRKVYDPEFVIMVRYYEPEDIQVYEKYLRTVFTIESVENDG